jgi:hypothetical protein
VTLGLDLVPRTDASGRVSYSRDGAAFGIIATILALAFTYPLCTIVGDYGMPGITDKIGDVHDLIPWAFAAGTVGFCLWAVHLFLSLRRLVFDPTMSRVTFVSRSLLGTKRSECAYGELTATVGPVVVHGPKGSRWTGFGLVVAISKSQMLLSRSLERDHVQEMARQMTSLTGMFWQPTEDIREFSWLEM